jgi:type II secretory pathway pseudopilin PulG
MNLTRCPIQPAAPRAAFTLVECLVVLAILFVLMAVLLPSFDVGHSSPRADQMQQGVHVYKAIFASVLADPDSGASQFPTSTDGFATSTHYFIQLVTNGTVKADFSFFSGPGLEKYRTSDPAQFKSDGNAWSVVLDVKEGIASYPFLISRNLLPGATTLPPRTAALHPDMLGETGNGPQLEFNTSGAVLITKAGTGFVLKKKDCTATEGSMKQLNPTDASHPIIRP